MRELSGTETLTARIAASMADPVTTSILISGAVAALFQGAAPLFRVLAGKKLATQKTRLQEIAQKQDEQDATNRRLVAENERLSAKVARLEEKLDKEEEDHEITRRELARVVARCEYCEQLMQAISRRRDFPQGPDDPQPR